MAKHTLFIAGILAFTFQAGAQTDKMQNGTPGPAVQVRVQAASSFVNNKEPLVIVDGHVTDMKSMVLNPSHIRSIDVLKNLSSTELYGPKGANGVVIIKTTPGTEFYTFTDFVNAEKNKGVQKVKLNDAVLTDAKNLLVEKASLKQTTVSSAFGLDETCKAVSQDMLVITATSGN